MKINGFNEFKLEFEMNPMEGILNKKFDTERVIKSCDSKYDIDTDDIVNDLNNLSYKNILEVKGRLDSMSVEATKRAEASLFVKNESLATLDEEVKLSTRQGKTGDCWLLAGVNSMLLSESGKQIINNLVIVDEEAQSASVYLPGVDKAYDVSFKELKANVENSTGDMDMRAIEIAVEKYAMEYTLGDKKFDANGNKLSTVFTLLAPQKSKIDSFIYEEKEVSKKLDEIQKSSGSYAATTAALIFDKDEKNQDAIINKDLGAVVLKKNSNKIEKSVKIESRHAYSISKVTSSHVYLINPWNSAETIRVDREPFEQRFYLSAMKYKN